MPTLHLVGFAVFIELELQYGIADGRWLTLVQNIPFLVKPSDR